VLAISRLSKKTPVPDLASERNEGVLSKLTKSSNESSKSIQLMPRKDENEPNSTTPRASRGGSKFEIPVGGIEKPTHAMHLAGNDNPK
jgi:hypothetical protein